MMSIEGHKTNSKQNDNHTARLYLRKLKDKILGTVKNNSSITSWLTWILLKYCPASNGITLYVEIPVMGSSVGLVAV